MVVGYHHFRKPPYHYDEIKHKNSLEDLEGWQNGEVVTWEKNTPLKQSPVCPFFVWMGLKKNDPASFWRTV